MSSIEDSGRNRPEFSLTELSLTELSTVWLLVGVACTCAALWAVIASTIGV